MCNTQAKLDITSTRVVLAAFSLLFSVVAFTTDSLINTDGVLYITMAEAFLKGGLAATSGLFDWPFFSMLIAWGKSLLGIDFEQSARLINTILFVLFTDALILISTQLLSSRVQIIFAAILILSFVLINDYRSYIIRDIGYWAFLTTALYQFIRFIQTDKYKFAVLWQIASLFALLFRVEALVIMVITPFFLFIHQPIGIALKNSLKLTSLLIPAIIVSATTLYFNNSVHHAFGKLEQFGHFTQLQTFYQTFYEKSQIIAQQILNQYSEEYSSLILASGLLSMFFIKMITGIGLSNIGLFLFARVKKTRHPRLSPLHLFLIFFALINAVILILFLYKSMFISTRYMVMFIVSLFLLILPTVGEWLEDAWVKGYKPVLFIFLLIVVFNLTDSFYHSVSKTYIKTGAKWASQELSEQNRVLTDSKLIHFYYNLNEPKSQIDLVKNLTQFESYDYVIVVHKIKHKERHAIIKKWPLSAIHSERNKRGDKVTIYKINHSQ